METKLGILIAFGLCIVLLCVYLYIDYRKALEGERFFIHISDNPYRKGEVITNGNRDYIVIRSYSNKVYVKSFKRKSK